MWEAFGNIPKAYYEGREQAYKQKMRDVFSDENGDHGGRTVHFIKAIGLADCDR
jgi:hypothetical protein